MNAILTARQSGQEIRWQKKFPECNFTQFVNRNVKIKDGRLFSLSLKDVAWLEDAQSMSIIFHSFVCKFDKADAICGQKVTDKCMEN